MRGIHSAMLLYCTEENSLKMCVMWDVNNWPGDVALFMYNKTKSPPLNAGVAVINHHCKYYSV